MATTQEVIAKVFLDGTQAQGKIKELEDKARQFRLEYEKAFKANDFKGMEKAKRAIKDCEKQMATFRTSAQEVNKVLSNLSTAGVKDLNRTIKAINAELSSGRIRRGSDEWNVLNAELSRCKTELAAIKQESAAVSGKGFFSSTADFLNKQWFVITSFLQSITGLSTTVRKCVQDFADIESEMANTRKFTGMTAEQVAALNDEFKKLDTRTSRKELNLLAQEAGRLGKTSKEDIMGYIRASVILNVALSDLGEGATQTIAKLTNIFGDEKVYGTEQALLKVGSVVNVLSQNCTASKPYLTDFAQRLAGVGAQAGMTVPQIMAFGAVLDSQGQKVEMSATAMSKLITDMFKNTSKLCKATGLDVTTFSETLKRSTNDALVMLLERLHDMGDMSVLASVFKDMGEDGARATSVLAALADKVDFVKVQLANANRAFEQGTSVGKEFEIQNSTVAASLDKAKKEFYEVSVALGEKLQPIVKYTVTTFGTLVKALNAIIDFASTHVRTILSVTSAIVIYTTALNANVIVQKTGLALVKMGDILYKALRVAYLAASVAINTVRRNTVAATAAQNALNNAIKANPYMLIIATLASVGVAIYNYVKHVNEERKAAEEAAKANRKWIASLTDIKKSSDEIAHNEAKNARILYNAATDEKAAREERLKAAQRLKELYPEYLEKMSAEEILLGKAKTQFNELTKAIILNAKARAAADKIKANEAELLDIEDELKQKTDALNKASSAYTKAKLEANRERKRNEENNETQMSAQYAEAYARREARIASAELSAVQKKKEQIEKANEELAKKYGVEAKQLQELMNTTATTTNTNEDEDKDKDKQRHKRQRDADRQEQAALEMHLVELSILYAKGEKDYFAYQDEMYEAQKASLEKRQAIWDEDTKEYADIAKQLQDLEDKRTAGFNAEDAKSLEREHQAKMALIKASMDEEGNYTMQSEGAINEALYQENVRYLQAKRDLYMRGTKEWYDLDAQLCDTMEREQLRKQQAYQEQLNRMREQYGMMSVEEQKRIALDGLDNMYKALKEKGLMAEEEYQRMRLAIIAEYTREDVQQQKDEKEKSTQDILDAARGSLSQRDRTLGDADLADAGLAGATAGIAVTIRNYRSMYDEIERMRQDNLISQQEADEAERQLKMDTMTAIVANVTGAYDSINQIVNAAAAYSRACSDYEVATITADYDRQIAAAGNNSKKKEKLEKERDEKVKEAKKKANDKAMKIELAQAIASTAMAAINAYASAAQVPVIGYILGPIAAAAALAAGALQIATIKKSHAAEAAGYYSGGFTGGRRYRKEAGVVHEGEFVANHNAVNNPNLLPFFEFVDQAQRNNTVSSLTAEDVRSISGGGGTAVMAPVVNVTSDNSELRESLYEMNEAVMRLNRELEKGIKAPVVLDGHDGLVNRMNEYEKLRHNV